MGNLAALPMHYIMLYIAPCGQLLKISVAAGKQTAGYEGAARALLQNGKVDFSKQLEDDFAEELEQDIREEIAEDFGKQAGKTGKMPSSGKQINRGMLHIALNTHDL